MKDVSRIEQNFPANPLHDVATELCVVLLCCDALRRKAGVSYSKEQLQQIGRIERSADRIRSLFKELVGPAGTGDEKEVETVEAAIPQNSMSPM